MSEVRCQETSSSQGKGASAALYLYQPRMTRPVTRTEHDECARQHFWAREVAVYVARTRPEHAAASMRAARNANRVRLRSLRVIRRRK